MTFCALFEHIPIIFSDLSLDRKKIFRKAHWTKAKVKLPNENILKLAMDYAWCPEVIRWSQRLSFGDNWNWAFRESLQNSRRVLFCVVVRVVTYILSRFFTGRKKIQHVKILKAEIIKLRTCGKVCILNYFEKVFNQIFM